MSVEEDTSSPGMVLTWQNDGSNLEPVCVDGGKSHETISGHAETDPSVFSPEVSYYRDILN